MKSTQIALLLVVLPFFCFSQETQLEKMARISGDIPDSSSLSFNLTKEADELCLNEQYSEAMAKCNEAIKLNPYNGKAYNIRAFSQLKLHKSNAQVIDDLTKALKYGVSNPGVVFFSKAISSTYYNSPTQNPCDDFIEATLAGEIEKTLLSKKCDTSTVIPISYSVTFVDNNFENAKIKVEENGNFVSEKQILINKLDDKALLLVIDYTNKVVWYDNLKKNINGKFNFKKWNQSAFLGRYAKILFFVENGHFPLPSISIDFLAKKIITYEEFKNIKRIKLKPLEKIEAIFNLLTDGNISVE